MKSLLKFIQIHRRVRQGGTLYSFIVTLMLFGFFLEAYMHNFNLVYITLFFVFAIAFSAGPMGTFNIGELEAKFEPRGRLFANTLGKLYFNITNNSKTPAWAITLHIAKLSSTVGRIDAKKSQLASIEITLPSRGEAKDDECYLQSFFPLRTVRFVLPIDGGYHTLVYPQPLGIPLRSFIQKQAMHFGEEKDFDGLAPYSGTEPLSRIHWASVAKGETAVKTFAHEQTTQELAFNFVDAGENDEARLSQLCLWVLECEQSHQPFTIQMPRKFIKSKKESIDAILEYLARY